MTTSSILTDYFYGDEAEQFTYFRIPRLLITSPRFKGLSTEAKLLYGMMLDRMGLSTKNGWHDQDGRVFVYYTIEEICKDLHCGSEKAVKLVSELDGGKDRAGISLIERKRQGQGKPTKIYVKRFTTREVSAKETPESGSSLPLNVTSEIQSFGNRNSSVSEAEIQDFGKSKFKTSENRNSRVSDVETQDFGKSECNNLDNNYLDSIYPESVSPSNPTTTENLARAGDDGRTDGRLEREKIKKQICYDFLPYRLTGWELREADELLELMVEVAMNRSPAIRIGRGEFDTAYVQERFRSLTIDDIVQVLQGLSENEGRVTNVKAYLLTSLFNAAATGCSASSLSASSY